jgi:hypothetical protein
MTVTAAGFLTAFLLAWPYILLWDVLIDTSLRDYRLVFLIAYALYFVSFAYVARSAYQLALAIQTGAWRSFDPFSKEVLDSPLIKPVITTISGIIAATVSSFLTSMPH